MSTQLQYTLQRSHPSSALSYPIPKTLLLSPTSKSISKVHSFTMAPSASHTSSKAAFITKDYYSSALSPSSASTWSADSSDDSDCDRYDSSDEFCFDDIESRSSKSSSRFSSRASTSSSTSSPYVDYILHPYHTTLANMTRLSLSQCPVHLRQAKQR